MANNYLVPKDGTPLGGLIQDHVISGVKLSIRGRFFNREDYQQLVYQGLSHIKGKIKLLPPAIIKPIKLWSGKQVNKRYKFNKSYLIAQNPLLFLQILSTIIINIIPEGQTLIYLYSFAKIHSKYWKITESRKPNCGTELDESQMCEGNVIICKGHLVSGVLDKQQFGATTYGLIHCIYEVCT